MALSQPLAQKLLSGDSDSLLSGACISQWVASVCKKNSLGATLPSKSADGTIIVVVDTVAPYILRHSAAALCRELVRLKDTPVVAATTVILHRDLHSKASIACLRHISTSTIQVEIPDDVTVGAITTRVHRTVAECHVTHLKQTRTAPPTARGQSKHGSSTAKWLHTETCTVAIANSGTVKFTHTREGQDTDDLGNETERTTDDAAPTIQPHQLPYVLTETQKRDILQGTSGGLIDYQPDDADDFDDEDPDDDLDI